MKKCKNYFSFLVILLFVQQITFAQTLVTAQAAKTPATSSAQVKVFAKAVVLQNSMVHLVWENYDASEIQSMVIESSDDGLTFSQIDYALILDLIDIHLYNYPEQLDYNNHILMSSEHGGIRFMYNDVLQYRELDDNHPVWYRVKMNTFSGFTYISQHFSSNGQEQTENGKLFNSNEDIENNSMTNKQPVPKSPCPSVQTPPSGYASSGITQSYTGDCCSWTETQFYGIGLSSPVPNCANGNDWCCNNVPDAASCASGYAVDYCCVHHCAEYAQCSCVPWTCCSNKSDTIWVVTAITSSIVPDFDVTPTQDSICAGDSITLTANCTTNCTGITYQWMPGSLSGTSINVHPNSTTTYTITGTNSNIVGTNTTECSSQVTVTITVHPNPFLTPTATPTSICEGDASSLSSTSSIVATFFSWNPGGLLSSPVSVTPIATCTYTVIGTVTATGCSGSNTVTVTVFPNVMPAFNPVAPICSGAALSPLPTSSTNNISGTWFPAVNNTSTTTYTFFPSAGQCATPTTLTIAVNPNITPAFSPVAPICSGATLSPLPTTSINSITGTWSPALNNTTTTTYTFTPDSGQCANTVTSTIIVYPVPPAPTIVLNGSILYSSALVGNQWYFNGTLIPNATGYFYDTSVTGNGTYYVIVTLFNCTSDTSNYLLVNVGIEENSAVVKLNIFPNPTRDKITIETSAKQDNKEISVLNLLGQLIFKQPLQQQKSELDVSKLAKGIYFLKLDTDKGSVVRKFVKE